MIRKELEMPVDRDDRPPAVLQPNHGVLHWQTHGMCSPGAGTVVMAPAGPPVMAHHRPENSAYSNGVRYAAPARNTVRNVVLPEKPRGGPRTVGDELADLKRHVAAIARHLGMDLEPLEKRHDADSPQQQPVDMHQQREAMAMQQARAYRNGFVPPVGLARHGGEMRASSIYENPARIQPAYDHAAVRASQHGIPVDRRSSNSATTGRVSHGVMPADQEVGRGGDGWEAHKRHYEATTSPAQQEMDHGHLQRLHDHISRTWNPGDPHGSRVAADRISQWIGANHAFNGHLLNFMRQIGSEEGKKQAERQAARDGERAAGRTPHPAVPHHPQQSPVAGTVTKPGLISRAMAMYRGSA